MLEFDEMKEEIVTAGDAREEESSRPTRRRRRIGMPGHYRLNIYPDLHVERIC